MIKKRYGIKNLNLNQLVTDPVGGTIVYLKPEVLFLGPDFLYDSYTLLDCQITESPHYKLVKSIANGEDVKLTDYYRRSISGKLDWRSSKKTGDIDRYIFKYNEGRESIKKGDYAPVKVYMVDNKYYIYDGKHRAAMCHLMNVDIKCEIVDAKIALGGVFSYLFSFAESEKRLLKHKFFHNKLCRS